MRSIMSGLCVLLISVAGVHAQEAARARAAERAVVAEEQEQKERGLEPIGAEAAEVGADDALGLGQPEEPAGGMGTVENEMDNAENADGCTGAMGVADCNGDN